MDVKPHFGFNDVFLAEIDVINRRRASNEPARPAIKLVDERRDSSGACVLVPQEDASLIGLALSGGGIRSAAFCLGALQAMEREEVLKRVDYLSTVSGGGYIGCSLSAGLELTKGDFPFKVDAVENETPSMQHIRDFSNYLFPHGSVDFLHNASIYARGLVANAIVILPFLLVAAVLTILSYRVVADRQFNVFGIGIPNFFGLEYFVITAYLCLLLLVGTIIWGLFRSRPNFQRTVDAPSGPASAIGWVVVILLIAAFCELQAPMLDAMLTKKGLVASFSDSINKISAFLAPFVAAIGFVATKLGEFIKSAKESTRAHVWLAGYVAKAAVYLAAIVVPFLLWVVYLDISYWGICVEFPDYGNDCTFPEWLKTASAQLGPNGVIWFYLIVAAILIVLTLSMQPNANSLHPLYRDRLGKAFLFEPQATLPPEKELKEIHLRLSDLTCAYGPYHLINAALNIQNSKLANKRGRNADFFLFSSKFVGSEATHYVTTDEMQKVSGGLDLRTAMAISGAAASSNMGAQSIKALTPTLALLNIRLGYWLRNPLKVKETKSSSRNIWANYYFLSELFGLLNERRKSVYLTDGGHIENLGIYELLKRGCRVIIAIDAEADQEMGFGSFNTLVRYALIDLGVKIELPWQEVADKTKATNEAMENDGDAEKSKGPHCAVGHIRYPGGQRGILVYIKSSITGDENDYVFHYKKRYPDFPHETTLDQMFSEEQFEAYRALGYHATKTFFDRSNDFAKVDFAEFPEARAQIDLLDKIFPRARPGRPEEKHRFAEWLP